MKTKRSKTFSGCSYISNFCKKHLQNLKCNVKRACLFHFTLAGILSILNRDGVRGGGGRFCLTNKICEARWNLFVGSAVPNKFSDSTGKFGIASVMHQYYKEINLREKVSSESILKILKEFETKKATGVDNLMGKFLKDGANYFVHL